MRLQEVDKNAEYIQWREHFGNVTKPDLRLSKEELRYGSVSPVDRNQLQISKFPVVNYLPLELYPFDKKVRMVELV